MLDAVDPAALVIFRGLDAALLADAGAAIGARRNIATRFGFGDVDAPTGMRLAQFGPIGGGS